MALNNPKKPVVNQNKAQKTYTGRLYDRLTQFRANGTFCDYVMVAGDERISVHKVIMAACSDYFYAMVTLDMKEKGKNTITLDAIDGVGLRAVVDFAYSGKVNINLDNVSSILQAASYLQVREVVELCEAYVAKIIRPNNCVLLTPMIELYGIDDNYPDIENFIFDNFCDIPNEQLNALSIEQFTAILSDDRLKLRSESCLVKIVKDWMMANKQCVFDSVFIHPEEEPWVTFTLTMSNIRWCLISEENLNSIDEEILAVMNAIPKCQELLHEAKRYHTDIYRQPLMQNSHSRVRCDSKHLVVMPRTSTDSCYATFEITPHTTQGHPIEKNNNVLWQRAVSLNNFLFVCGGSDGGSDMASKLCRRYDPRFNKWLDIESMKFARRLFVLVTHGNSLYVIGGHEYGYSMTSTCETYDIETNTWSIISEYDSGIALNAGCVVGNDIYISGGVTHGRGCSSKVFRYNVPTDEWHPCAAMTHGRSGHSMEGMGEVIYVIAGGTDTIERYSIEADQWTNCKQTCEIFNCESFVSDGKIFVFGMKRDGKNKVMTFSEECDQINEETIRCDWNTEWRGAAVLSIPFHMATHDRVDDPTHHDDHDDDDDHGDYDDHHDYDDHDYDDHIDYDDYHDNYDEF